MSVLVWELEWQVALARRRLFALNVAVPLLLALPLALGAAPRIHAAAVYAVLFSIFGTFGSAIPLQRDAEAGLLARVVGSGVSIRAWLLQRVAAGAVLDALQLLPALVVAGIGAGASRSELTVTAVTLLASLWITNLLGVLVAAAARSVAETALLAVVSTLLLLHASGVFRTPVAGSIGAALEAASPLRALHEALLSMGTGVAVGGAVSLVLWAVALPSLALLLAGPLARAFRATKRG